MLILFHVKKSHAVIIVLFKSSADDVPFCVCVVFFMKKVHLKRQQTKKSKNMKKLHNMEWLTCAVCRTHEHMLSIHVIRHALQHCSLFVFVISVFLLLFFVCVCVIFRF